MRTPETSPASRPRSKRGRRRTMTAASSERAILKSTPPASEGARRSTGRQARRDASHPRSSRSEEHTSELQSQSNLVCRLLLEKKKKKTHENAECDCDQR